VSQFGSTGGPASGKAVTSSDFFCDTIVGSVGNNDYDCLISSPANDQVAHLRVDTKGSSFIECLFNRNGSATQANALIGRL
jgi:hypothetical protein